MSFQWDERKAKANLRKHGVSFDEAKTVFVDLNMKLIPDQEHSFDEDRSRVIGMSQRLRILVIGCCYRSHTIRIFSARKATPGEMKSYFRGE